MKTRLQSVVAVLSVMVAAPVYAQSVDLTVHEVGVSIGDSRRVTGLRLNFRDDRLEEVNGINATVWNPYRNPRGVVNGAALGVPLTGARRINGIAAGIFGVGADESITGIGIGGV